MMTRRHDLPHVTYYQVVDAEETCSIVTFLTSYRECYEKVYGALLRLHFTQRSQTIYADRYFCKRWTNSKNNKKV